MLGKKMKPVKIDKRTEVFTIRVPEILKVRLDKLSDSQKVEMVNHLLCTIAKHIHCAAFDPETYLSTKDEEYL